MAADRPYYNGPPTELLLQEARQDAPLAICLAALRAKGFDVEVAHG